MSRADRLDTALTLLEIVSSEHDLSQNVKTSVGPRLRQEGWIVNLGHDQRMESESDEKMKRIKYRLDFSNRPFVYLPEEQLSILAEISHVFKHEEMFEDVNHCVRQIAAIDALSDAVRAHKLMGKQLFYDFCRIFIENYYPLMRKYEDYCTINNIRIVSDPRMNIQMSLLHFWKLYDTNVRYLMKHHGERDPISNLRFEDILLPPDPLRGSGGGSNDKSNSMSMSKHAEAKISEIIGSSTGGGRSENEMRGVSASKSDSLSSVMTARSRLEDIGGLEGIKKIGVTISTSSFMGFQEPPRKNIFVKLLSFVPCFSSCLQHYGRATSTNMTVPSLSYVEQQIRKEHKRKLKKKRRERENLLRGENGLDHRRVQILSIYDRLVRKWNSFAKSFFKTLEKGLLLVALGPIVVSIVLLHLYENEDSSPYAPNELYKRIQLLLWLIVYFDLSIFTLLLVFYFIGFQQNILNGYHGHDRMMRIRPVTVLGISCLLGITSLRMLLGTDNLGGIRFLSIWIMILHIVVWILLYSQIKAFVKRAKYKMSPSTSWFSKLRILSTAKWIETKCRHCIKTTYRADPQGKGLALMQQHEARNNLHYSQLLSSPNQNTHHRRYIKSKKRRYKKALKNMKMEISVHMMEAIYAGMENAQKTALPTEICVLATHFSSYHSLHEHVLYNDKIRSLYHKLADLDRVFYYLLYTFRLAQEQHDSKSENWCRVQLTKFLVTDTVEWNSNLLVFKTKKRLHLLRQSTEANLAKLKKMGKFSLHKMQQHESSTVTGDDSKTQSKSQGNDSIKLDRNGEDDVNSLKIREDQGGNNVVEKVVLDVGIAELYVKSLKNMHVLEIITNGVLTRKEVIEDIVNLLGEQAELNCRISVHNMKRKWKHPSWTCAAAAANMMNVLHRGWTQTPVIDESTGKVKTRSSGNVEYVYFNKRLNAATNQSLANGLKRKDLPPWLIKSGAVCPHGNIWTARSIYESFHEILKRLEANVYNNKASLPYHVKENLVGRLVTRERSWAQSERQLKDALTHYLQVENSRMQASFQEVGEMLKQSDNMKGGEDTSSSSSDDEEGGID